MKVCLSVWFLTLEKTERSCNHCIKKDRRKIQHLIHLSVWCCLNIHQHVLETMWVPHTGLNRCEWHSSCLPISQILPMGLELQEEIKQAGSLSDKSRWWKGWRGGIQKGGRAGGLGQDGGQHSPLREGPNAHSMVLFWDFCWMSRWRGARNLS